MTRLNRARLVAGLLFVALLFALGALPAPYVVYQPGPTLDLLAKEETGYPIHISGHRTYRDDSGALRMLTVIPSGPDDSVSAIAAFRAWVLPSRAVYSKPDIYQPTETSDQANQQSAAEMTNSQDTAVAAALHALGYKFDTTVAVVSVEKGGPADGVLKVHDQILKVNGVAVPTMQGLVDEVQKVKPGEQVHLAVRRNGKVRQLTITTGKSVTDPTKSALKIVIAPGYDFPFQVKIKLDANIGGPSAGMMFALTIYDTLTPGSLAGGNDIAGTGTIDADGRVGPIGGIQQKLAAAQRAGAHLFLAPASNCDEVRGGPYNSDKMKVVKVSTLDQAIADINAYDQNHDAKLPTC